MLQLIAKFSSSLLYQAHEQRSFLSWMREYGQMYTGEEYSFRFGIYLSNKRYIQEQNSRGLSYKLGENQFMTFTPTEYNILLGGKQVKEAELKGEELKVTNDDVPESFDWREKGVVNMVKDQGSCGSCWAFSTVAAIESQWAIKHGELLSLSEQNLVDCVWDCLGCHGCVGNLAIGYIKKHQKGGIMLESEYPYTGKKGKCQFDQSRAHGKVIGYKTIKRGSESELKAAVATKGVVSILCDASHNDFHLYRSGVYDDPKCTKVMLDHMMDVVGYGAQDGKDYWLVRNSWGKWWGESGYIKMRRNNNDMCGVALNALVPEVE